MPLLSRPELLAPAGDWECARAAVENGADAIYFGLEKFNARMRAKNFTQADLPPLLEFLHARGVKAYVTFNTLVFGQELSEAERCLRTLIRCGVDAAIVQDVGICRLIRELSTDFPIHASTQMTVTSSAGVRFARNLGCNLVVLARECSVREIEAIQDAQNLPGDELDPMPLEVFIHGALCVAYSGQCLTSESLGGRSANRGECAQACRMPYELISDGKPVLLGGKQYLLSPQDLAGLEVLPDLIKAGVASLKIEGRLKSPEYVANVTRIYRQALDQFFSNNNLSGPEVQQALEAFSRQHRYPLEMSFSRGLFSGWFRGIDNQKLVHGEFAKKRGPLLGGVTQINGQRVQVKLNASLKEGDGIVFSSDKMNPSERGGRVSRIEENQGEAWLTFHHTVDLSGVERGDRIWKTSDPALDREIRQTFSGDKPHHQRPLDLEVYGNDQHPLTLVARDELGNQVELESSVLLVRATKSPLTGERLREQLGRLGGTPFKLGQFKNFLEGELILPVSELNKMRRQMVELLIQLRSRPARWSLASEARPTEKLLEKLETLRTKDGAFSRGAASELIVLARTMEQLEVTLRSEVKNIYLELEDPKKYREGVRGARDAGFNGKEKSIWAVPPRIFKAGEDWILNLIRSSNPDGYLVRNYDQLEIFKDERCIGDFSLNISNPFSADYFKNTFGLERLTASYDLNATQLQSLLTAGPPGWFEVTIHQHMPMFHMEHCVFCAFLSKGKDYRDCGRPCDHHEVRLRDRVGAEHVLKADAGCRNTLFNSRAQTGAEFVSRFQDWGVKFFRIEFLKEAPAEVIRTINQYRRLLAGEIKGSELWRELKLINQIGVTRGQMEGVSG